MEKYNLESKTTSCVLSKNVLKEIEVYLTYRLLKKLNGVLGLTDKAKTEYHFILKDGLGEETLLSVDDYHREKLPNELEEIILEYRVNYLDADIRIRFSKGFMLTNIKIGLHCDGAKEIALGIKSEIEAILLENRTIHYIFYGKFAWIAWGIFLVAFDGGFLIWGLVKFPSIRIRFGYFYYWQHSLTIRSGWRLLTQTSTQKTKKAR